MEKRQGLRGLLGLINHGSKPRDHYSSLNNKSQGFGVDIKFTRAIGVLHEVLQDALFCYRSEITCRIPK